MRLWTDVLVRPGVDEMDRPVGLELSHEYRSGMR